MQSITKTRSLQRIPKDYYPTPDPITLALLNTVSIGGRVLEPCAGHGAIAKFFPNCITNDPYPSLDFEPDYQMDAGEPTFWQQVGDVDFTITNPPYDAELMLSILQNALIHSRKGVAILARLTYLEPCRQRAELLQSYSDSLRYFIPVSPRPRFRRDTKGSDNATVAWLVWDKQWSWQKLGIDCPFKFVPGWR